MLAAIAIRMVTVALATLLDEVELDWLLLLLEVAASASAVRVEVRWIVECCVVEVGGGEVTGMSNVLEVEVVVGVEEVEEVVEVVEVVDVVEVVELLEVVVLEVVLVPVAVPWKKLDLEHG